MRNSGSGKLSTKLNSRLEASEALSGALEEQLTRRFPKQLRWDRNAAAGPTVKTIAHRFFFF